MGYGDETFLFCGGFCVFVCVVVLGPLLSVSNCLIPSSSHKSRGAFQVLVKGHRTYSWAYVWVCRVSHVSLTWTAGILEICCSLRGKKNKHILGGLVVNWDLIRQHLWTEGPSILSREELTRRLFLLRTSSTTETVYRGNDPDKWNPWKQHRRLVWNHQSNMPPQMTLRMSAWIHWGRTNYQAYLTWLEFLEHQQTQSGRFKTKKGYWVVKRCSQT